ncbi:hypothetical protein T484DRAFT_2021193 [Baffinella frigidus]|nr:hypothetical protein T484DRAFT_2021193 [Cryptophyta sp. CCMP2293]
MPRKREGNDVHDLGRRFESLSTARVEIPVPGDKVGLVIGKQGATIQKLQKQAKAAHCFLEFKTPPIGHPGKLVIKGPDQGAVDSFAVEAKKIVHLDDVFSPMSSTASAASTTVAELDTTGGSRTASEAGTTAHSGGARQPRAIKENFGITPWTKVDDKFYFLAQVSYSAKLYNIKIDPLRGTRKTEDASNWHAAVRETREESAHVLRFSAEELPVDAKPNIPVAVLVEFESCEDLSQFCASYDDNRVRAHPPFGKPYQTPITSLAPLFPPRAQPLPPRAHKHTHLFHKHKHLFHSFVKVPLFLTEAFVPQRKVVDERVLGKDEAKNTAESLGLTWVDPIRIKRGGDTKSSRMIQEEIVEENVLGGARGTSQTLGITCVDPDTITSNKSAEDGKPSRFMQDEPKYRVAEQLKTGLLLAMKKSLEEGDPGIPRCVLRRSVDDKGLAAYTALPDPSSISTVAPSLSDLGQCWSHSTPFSASEKWLWERRRQHLREYPQVSRPHQHPPTPFLCF